LSLIAIHFQLVRPEVKSGVCREKLIGFLPARYALNTNRPEKVESVLAAVRTAQVEEVDDSGADPRRAADIRFLEQSLYGKESFAELGGEERWGVRQAIFRTNLALAPAPRSAGVRKTLNQGIEFVPIWVVVGVALALGFGTMVGYKRIVVTVAERIGKTHLTYAQGAAAEIVACATILLADIAHAPVSTTQVLSSGVAGTMAANGSGVRVETCRKIALAWVLTLPGTGILAGGLFFVGRWLTR
jgi:phosphate/sulfate permease